MTRTPFITASLLKRFTEIGSFTGGGQGQNGDKIHPDYWAMELHPPQKGSYFLPVPEYTSTDSGEPQSHDFDLYGRENQPLVHLDASVM